MSGGGGKIKYWEYYGSLAGVVCAGPVDVLDEIIVDGESAWRGPLYRNGATNYSTITLDSKRVIRFYWGSETQITDPLLAASGNDYGNEHPPYRGVCYVVLVNFYFGRERVSAPNIEVVVRRKPQQAVFSNGAAELHDGQASPVASLADIYTNPRYGLGLPAERFDEGRFFGAADALYLGGADAKTYISMLLNRQATARTPLADLSLVGDLWLRHNAQTDKVEAGVFPHHVPANLDALPILTADDLTERPQLKSGGWGDVETGWAVAFTDRDRGYKESTEKHDDLRALRVVGEHRRSTIQRPWITRRGQAAAHGREYAKVKGQPTLTGTLTVRREKAMPIQPGDLIRVDIEPEPGGLQLQQVCRVLERTITPTGPIKLRIEGEKALSPVAFTPLADLPQTPQSNYPPAVEHVRLFEIPPPLAAGNSYRIGVLAERPQALVTGCDVHYDSAETGDFLSLGVQEFFAQRGRVAQAWSDSATGPLRFELLSTLDRHLLDDDPGEVAARNDTLLAIVAQTEANGAIAEDASGSPMLEVLSIVGFHLVAANTYEATVFRGRVGTRKRSFSAGAEVWIIPRVGITSFIHADFGALQADGQLGFFRLQPFSIFAARELSDCPNVRFNFPSGAAYAPVVIWDHPTDLLTSLSAAPAAVAFRGRVEDQDRNLVQFSLAYRPSDGSETTVVNQPLGRVGSHPFDHSIQFPSSGLYTVTARAQDDSGRTTESVRQIEITPPADQVATPVISPTTGGYRSSRTVTITCSTPGATILYVVTSSFGSPPETGWLRYNPAAKPVVPVESRIWAKATLAGFADSGLAFVYYWFDEPDWNNGGNYLLP